MKSVPLHHQHNSKFTGPHHFCNTTRCAAFAQWLVFGEHLTTWKHIHFKKWLGSIGIGSAARDCENEHRCIANPATEGLHILAMRMTDAQYIRMEGKSSSVLSRPMLLTPRSPARRWIVTFRLHIGTRLVDAHDERRTAPPDLRLVSAFLDSLSEDVLLPLW
jgi:hypothetical protein